MLCPFEHQEVDGSLSAALFLVKIGVGLAFLSMLSAWSICLRQYCSVTSENESLQSFCPPWCHWNKDLFRSRWLLRYCVFAVVLWFRPNSFKFFFIFPPANCRLSISDIDLPRGSGYYLLSKPESVRSHKPTGVFSSFFRLHWLYSAGKKLVCVDKTTGQFYEGLEARSLLDLKETRKGVSSLFLSLSLLSLSPWFSLSLFAVTGFLIVLSLALWLSWLWRIHSVNLE